MEKIATAKMKYAKIAPRKARLLADIIRKMPVKRAEAELIFAPQRAAAQILKTLRSAVANAVHNGKADPSKLFISEIRVDGGPMLKRWMPRARGSLSMIQKKTSHINITLGSSDKISSPDFVFFKKEPKIKIVKSKNKKPSGNEKDKHPSIEEAGEIKKTGSKKPGVMKRIFRRKSI